MEKMSVDEACLAMIDSAKEFAVKFSGHGSKFRFDGLNPEKPTLPPMTFKDAYIEADRWIGISDSIGGDAVIYHIPSGKNMEMDRLYALRR